MADVRTRLILSLFIVFIILLGQVSYAETPTNEQMFDRFERNVGRNAVSDLVQSYGGEYFLSIQERMWLDEIFHRLVTVTTRDGIDYNLTVLNSSEINAFSLPGGYIFITRGLLRSIGGDEHQVAAVLAHEIAHVESRHGLNAVLRQMGLTVLMEVGMFWLDLMASEAVRLASATALQLMQLGWGREAEFEADWLGQKYVVEAGFDPAGGVMLMDYLMSIESDEQPLKLFRTHPDNAVRRDRMVNQLSEFWIEPQIISERDYGEVLESRRNSNLSQRMDPLSRYELILQDNGFACSTLSIYDHQLDRTQDWLADYIVTDVTWSPDGSFFAAIVHIDDRDELWFINRTGKVVERRDHYAGLRLSELTWVADRDFLIYKVYDGHRSSVMVSYAKGAVDLMVSGDLFVEELFWDESRIVFRSENSWYVTLPPQVEPIVITNPVPRVLERPYQLAPTVTLDEDRITLTRPQLQIP